MDAFLSALAPHLLELIAAVRHREALHSALMTGVRYALSRGLQDRQAVVEAAVNYLRTSVPDALARLKPRQEQLIKMAEATLEGSSPPGSAGDHPGRGSDPASTHLARERPADRR